jgi:membrane protein DedA with SNARE-associated domain
MSGGFLDRLTSLPADLVYLAVGLLVFAEDALFIGFLLPGETAAILGGVTASTQHTVLPVMIIVVVAAAIVGDTVGYTIGNRYGIRLLDMRLLARRRDRIERARDLLARRGGPAVFLGRFVAFLRALMPFLSGTAHLRYRTFLAYNAAGGVVWGGAAVLLGYLAGMSYQAVARIFGEVTAFVVAAVVVVLIVVRVRRSRADRR